MVGSLPAGCVRPTNGQVTAPPSTDMKSRRLKRSNPSIGEALPLMAAQCITAKVDWPMSLSGQRAVLSRVIAMSACQPTVTG